MAKIVGQMSSLLEITKDNFPKKMFETLPFAIRQIDRRPTKSPTISIERHLTGNDIFELAQILKDDPHYQDIDQLISLSSESELVITVKEYICKKDIESLVSMVASYYHQCILKRGIVPDNLPGELVQVVEIDFTMIDLYPGDTQIHYRLFTKRGLDFEGLKGVELELKEVSSNNDKTLELLRCVINCPPFIYNTASITGHYCFFCGEGPESHAEDCLHIEIKKFLDNSSEKGL